MNVTNIENDCKIKARKCFENFKHHIKNYPLEGEIDIKGVIKYEIEQEFGRSVLKNHITGNESKQQLKLILNIVDKYKNLLIKTSKNWSKKYITKN